MEVVIIWVGVFIVLYVAARFSTDMDDLKDDDEARPE